MSDEKTGPDHRPTAKLSEAEIQKELLNKVLRTVEDGFARQDARSDAQDERLDKIERQVDVAVQDGKENNKRITTLEVRFDEMKTRQDSGSLRAKAESGVNLQQDAAIAMANTRLERLEGDVGEVKADVGKVKEGQAAAATERAETAAMVKEVRDSVVGVINNPKVRAVARVVWVLVIGYAVARGIINHNDAKAVLP